MLSDGLSYPTRGDDWVKRLLIGALLTVGTLLILPTFLLAGYFVRVLQRTAHGDDRPPEWRDWGTLAVDGLKATLITVAYAVVPLLVVNVAGFVLFGVVGVAGSAAGEGAAGVVLGAGLLVILLLFLLQMVVFLLVAYTVPGALLNFAAEDRIGAAFDFGALTDIWFSSDYLVAMLLPLVVGTLVNVVTLVLSITVVGLLLVPFVVFWGNLVTARLIGRAYLGTVGGSAPGTGGRRREREAF